jgi:uncharacterized iron-regulated protein
MRHVIGLLLCAALLACRTPGNLAPSSWEPRLTSDAIVMLGEVHDNVELHRMRLDVLTRALAAGWRPAIVMEQFDIERQADIDRARREQPHDPQHVIDLAASRVSGSTGGWNWEIYRPVIALALDHDLPLVAANLSRADAEKVVKEGFTAILSPERLHELKLDRPIPAPWQAAQEHEIDTGHCHALPASLLPAMARAQIARDAVMARVIEEHAATGVVLLAGDGHVRRDLGVPRWLGEPLRQRLLSVGYLEQGDRPRSGVYDAIVYAAPQPRAPVCEGLLQRKN